MANTTINQLTSLAGASLADVDLFLIHDVSAAIEKQISAADLRIGMGIQPNTIDVSSTSDALRVTQRGTGNAIRIEDSTNPDATPFIITSAGDLLVGHTAQIQTDNDSGTLITPKHQIHGTSEAGSALGLYTWNTSSSNGPHIVFSKSSSGTIGTRTVVTSGTDLGGIVFNGDDGVGFTVAAEILAEVDGTAGVGDMPGRIVFLTTADGANTVTERMRITSSGLVGIATASPQATLDVGGLVSGSDRSIRVGGTGNVYGQVSVTTSTSLVNLIAGNSGVAGSNLAILTAATDGTETERIRITSDGYVGVGTNSPTQKLDVNDSSIRIRTSNTPASATATGTAGQVAWDANYVYVCVATNTWKRAALSTW